MLCRVGGAENGLRARLASVAEQKFCRPLGGDETSWAPPSPGILVSVSCGRVGRAGEFAHAGEGSRVIRFQTMRATTARLVPQPSAAHGWKIIGRCECELLEIERHGDRSQLECT